VIQITFSRITEQFGRTLDRSDRREMASISSIQGGLPLAWIGTVSGTDHRNEQEMTR